MNAAVHSPRVVGALRADGHSLEALLASPPFVGRSGEAFALAVYDYFSSTVDGTWHGWPPNEREGDPVGWGDVGDPIKLLNAYGGMICGQCAELLLAVYTTAGMPARIRGLRGHLVCEVFYDDRWHLLDVDMWSWFRTPDGHIAGVDELCRQPRALILENAARSNPCGLPDRPLEDYARMFEAGEATVFPRWFVRAHTMDFVLRPGETLTRSQTHEGRYLLPLAWEDNLRVKHRDEWAGIPRERFAPFRTVGNGRWRYAPDLSGATRDFELGVWDRQGIAQDAQGLVGPGQATFRIQSPYPFCGIPDPTRDGFPSTYGVWLSLVGSGRLRAEVTTPEGDFVDVAETTGTFAVRSDLTELHKARYATFIRMTLDAGCRLERFAFDAALMTAPGSLPRLVEGANAMELRTGDQHGKRTTPWHVPVDFRSERALRSHWVAGEAAELVPWKRGRLRIAPVAKGPAMATFRFPAPDSRHFAWAYAIATVPEGPVDAPPRHATLEWSADGKGWLPCAHLQIPNTPLQWDASIDGEFQPPEPVRELWVRVSSGTGCIALEFMGHLDEPSLPGPLRIVHRWTEQDRVYHFEVPGGRSSYVFVCGPEPRAHTVEMSHLSVPRPSRTVSHGRKVGRSPSIPRIL